MAQTVAMAIMNGTKAREGSLQFDVMPVFMALFYFGIIVKKNVFGLAVGCQQISIQDRRSLLLANQLSIATNAGDATTILAILQSNIHEQLTSW